MGPLGILTLPFWAAAPKGTKSGRTQGTFVHPFVCSSPPRPSRAWGERTDEQTDQTKVPCVLRDFVPFGAAALPLIPIYNHAKQGNGYR